MTSKDAAATRLPDLANSHVTMKAQRSQGRFASSIFRHDTKATNSYPPEAPSRRGSEERNGSGLLVGVVHFVHRHLGSITGVVDPKSMAIETEEKNVSDRNFSRFRALESRIGDWRLDGYYRRKNLHIFLNAMFGVAVAVAELLIYPIDGDGKHIQTTNLFPSEISVPVIMSTIISVSTIILIIQLRSLHKMYEREKRMIWGDGSNMRYWNFENTTKAALEVLIVLIHPWPMEQSAMYREGTTVWMFLRMYLVVRVVKDHSDVFVKRKQIVLENFEHSSAPAFNWWLSLQMVFSHSPDISLVTFTVCCIIVFSLGTYMCERDYSPETFTLVNTTWYVYSTFLTLDIGEFTVHTWSGRTITCVMIAAGVFMNTLVVVAILDNISLDAKGRVALAYIHRTRAQESIHNAAGAFIVSWVRWQTTKSKSLDPVRWTKQRLKMGAALENMRNARYKQQITELSLGDPVLDKLQSLDLGIMKIYHKVSPKDAPAIEPKQIKRTRRRSSISSLDEKQLRHSNSCPLVEPSAPDTFLDDLVHLTRKQDLKISQNKAVITALETLLARVNPN